MSGPLGSSQWMYSSGFYPYEIEQSLRLNDDDSAYLSRTPASAGNRKTWTWSGWVKRGNIGTGSSQALFGGGVNNTNRTLLFLNPSDNLQFDHKATTLDASLTTTAVFRDPSAWYHVILACDTTQATAADRVRLYVNGVELSFSGTDPVLNDDFDVSSTDTQSIGSSPYNTAHFDGYMAEVNFIDGTALDPTSFGEFKSGVWIPKKYTGSYGTNGFYLSFADSAAIGDDLSGNGNDWTPSGLASTDVLLDSPTNNWAVMNPLGAHETAMVYAQGNLQVTTQASGGHAFGSIAIPNTTPVYFEQLPVSGGGNVGYIRIGTYDLSRTVGYYQDGRKNVDGALSSYGAAYAFGDVVGAAVNIASGTVEFFKNGVSQGVISYSFPEEDFFAMATDGNSVHTVVYVYNFGQDSSFAGAVTRQGNVDANGRGDFYYAPPSGYLALCTANLPEPTITPALDDVPSDYFNTVLYTGTGATQSITGVGFQPDFLWIKNRSNASNHYLYDAIRGAGNGLYSDLTSAEVFEANQVTSIDADGFSVSTGGATNGSGNVLVAWNWKAAGAGVANTDGTISSTVSANQKAGFSIVSYTGTGANATVGHGLGVAPEMVIVKRRDAAAGNWAVHHKDLTDASYYLWLNSTQAQAVGTNIWNSTAPSSSVFSIGTSSNTNTSSGTYIAYCFAEVEGYSKFGSYTGNGSTDGPFVWCGFRPAFVMVKRTSSSGSSWAMFDNTRSPENVAILSLNANVSDAEYSTLGNIDMLSNGFKLRNTNSNVNLSGATYIFAAFAENPFKYSNAR